MNGDTTMNQEFESPRVEPAPVDAAPRSRAYAVHDRFLDDPRRKSPWLAAIFSAMPGLGQIYVGYYQRGFVHALVVGGLIAIIAGEVIEGDVVGVVGFLLAFFWLYNVIDAARRASLYNQALSGLRPMDLPEDAKAPNAPGSLAGGVGLIVAGLVFFSNTMFGVSLRWIGDWWPMGLVLIGAWLVYGDYRARQNRDGGNAEV
jgi:hypothetical protein